MRSTSEADTDTDAGRLDRDRACVRVQSGSNRGRRDVRRVMWPSLTLWLRRHEVATSLGILQGGDDVFGRGR